MSENFFNLSEEEQVALIRQAGDQLDLPDVIIEKDLWVCWLLEKVFSLPMQMAFKGGTSLSKVFGLIHRFSEDIDITIDYHNFKPELNLEALSKTQLKKVSDALKEELKGYISTTVLPFLQKVMAENFKNKAFEVTLSDDGEQLRIYYPSILKGYLLLENGGSFLLENGGRLIITEKSGYLRDHVLLEFGVRNSAEPCEKHLISTYLSQTVPGDFVLPKPMIDTLSPIRTFWEKATLIHVECHRDRMDKTPERLSRHWYDLYMLNNSWVGEEALSGHEILASVIEHKKAFFNASYANYEDCLAGKFRLIPSEEYLHGLKQDFLKMIDAGMFSKSPSGFEEMIKILRILEWKINSTIDDGVGKGFTDIALLMADLNSDD